MQQPVQQTDLKQAAARVLERASATTDATSLQQGVEKRATNDPDLLHSAGVILDLAKARQAIKDREQQRARVLTELEQNPGLTYSWFVDESTDPVTLIVAKRGAWSCDLTVELGKFDPFRFIEVTQSLDCNPEPYSTGDDDD